jgi:hypothetical protein
VTAKEEWDNMAKGFYSVSDFTSNIAAKGLASSNKFEVAIHFPNGVNQKAMDVMCDTASIKGKSINSTPSLHYGVRREIAYAAPVYEPLTLTFYCSEKLEEKKRLDNWQELMVKTVGFSGAGGSFDVGYYDDYAKSSKIIVTKLSVSGDVVLRYEYLEAYPKSVASIELTHGVSSGPMKVSALFEYSYWKDTTPS